MGGYPGQRSYLEDKLHFTPYAALRKRHYGVAYAVLLNVGFLNTLTTERQARRPTL